MRPQQNITQLTRAVSNAILANLARPWLRLQKDILQELTAWRPRLSCLVFHDIQPDHESIFRAQLEMLRQHFEIVDLPEFGRRLRGAVAFNRDTVLLTFDDAYASGVRVGKILAEYGWRGVFFVPPGFIECHSQVERMDFIYHHLFYGLYSPGTLPAALRPMTWEQLAGLAAAGHHIGCHTRSHPPLNILNTVEKREKELIESAGLLEARLGCRVEAFAAPFGTVESFSRESLARLLGHYRYVFTSVRGDNRARDREPLLRETILADDTPDYVLLQAAGGLDWAYWRARRALRRLSTSRVAEEEGA